MKYYLPLALLLFCANVHAGQLEDYAEEHKYDTRDTATYNAQMDYYIKHAYDRYGD